MENLNAILSIIGSLTVIVLSVNAFFLRAIYQDLGNVKISLAKIYVKGESKEERIKNLEENQKEIFHRLSRVERDT